MVYFPNSMSEGYILHSDRFSAVYVQPNPSQDKYAIEEKNPSCIVQHNCTCVAMDHTAAIKRFLAWGLTPELHKTSFHRRNFHGPKL